MSSFASKEEGSADREASLTATLPNLDHFRMADAAKVYEPAEDTFLLCDALWQDRDFIFHINPIIALEIGSGSGCVITYLTQLLASRQQHCLCLATDVNPHALAITQRTAKANEVILDSIGTDLVQHVEERLHQQIDILIFNPPYVPTDSEEIHGNGIEVSWAGGIDGREVIDRLLPKFKDLISEKGACYMVVVKENKPADISRILAKDGFVTKLIITRRAVNEELSIMKISRKTH